MILSHVSDSARYEALHPLFKKVFDYVKANDLLQAPAGRIVLDGDALFINVCDANLVTAQTFSLCISAVNAATWLLQPRLEAMASSCRLK